MKLSEGMKLVDQQWVRKKKGYRVHFQKIVAGSLVTDYVPGLDNQIMDSDVAAWRFARKLSLSGAGQNLAEEEHLLNLWVVDDLGERVKHYGTYKFEVYNPL